MIGLGRPFVMLSTYKKELYALLCGIIVSMAVLALYSFDPHDPSWFFVSSHHYPMSNWCGIVGSYFAGLLMHLFGAASYVAVFLMGVFLYWFATYRTWKAHWERIAAAFGVVLCVSALCTLHQIELVDYGLYGGIIGFRVAGGLHRLFDMVGSLILVYSGLYASLILLLQFSFMGIVSGIYTALKKVYEYIDHYQVFQRLFHLVTFVVSTLYSAIRWLFMSFVRKASGYSSESQSGTSVVPYDPQLPRWEQQTHADTDPVAEQIPDYPAQHQQSVPFSQPRQVPREATQQPHASQPQKAQFRPRHYGLPSQDIFIGIKEKKDDELYRQELEERAAILEEKLERFGVTGEVISIKNGPVVTLFEYQPDIDTKISKILALEDDLSLALQAHSIRILAPIPGRSVVGFEVSNQERKDVLFASIVQSSAYEEFSGSLPLILGKNTIGDNVVVDLAKMPHLLIAGSTGSGKSVALNAMLVSLLCKKTPDELKLILIDPKRLEFASYADVSHLLFPIITEPKKTIPIMRWVVQQMEQRYEKMAACGARNVFDYNKLAAEQSLEHFPFIVVVIDELADLMMTVGREIEDLITRVAQMARAAGIHMIVATQRPSVDVITGLIKVNFPSRISFRVTSKVDSRTILDCGGADKLLGRGDMLFLDSTASTLKRIHGAYVSDDQIGMVVSHIRSQREVEYLDISQQESQSDSDMSPEDEELFQNIISFIDEVDEVSISLLQRKFKIGYNRSARIIDMLESRGLIMPADGSKTRRVIR